MWLLPHQISRCLALKLLLPVFRQALCNLPQWNQKQAREKRCFKHERAFSICHHICATLAGRNVDQSVAQFSSVTSAKIVNSVAPFFFKGAAAVAGSGFLLHDKRRQNILYDPHWPYIFRTDFLFHSNRDWVAAWSSAGTATTVMAALAGHKSDERNSQSRREGRKTNTTRNKERNGPRTRK